MMHPGSSLESWTARIQGQLRDVLEPTERFSEISPTEALGISLNANTKWTLIALANLARDDDSSAVRTLALVTLREFVVREADDRDSAKLWDVLAVSTQKAVQKSLLQCFQNDRSATSAREGKTLCRTCSYILEMDNASGHGWPELHNTLHNLLSPESSANQQRLFYEFITEYPLVVADMPATDLKHALRHGLASIDKNPEIVKDALKACVVILTFDDRYNEFKDIVPEMLNTLPLLHAQKASPELSKSLYTILELYESQSSTFLIPYINPFIPFIISLLPNTTIDYLRQSAIEFITATSEYYSSTIKEHALEKYQECVAALLNMMTELRNDESLEIEFWKSQSHEDEIDNSEIYIVAEDALNRVSLALGPEHVLPTAFRIIPTFLSSEDWRYRYASLSAIGTLAESSAQLYLGNLEQLMRMVIDGLSDPSPRVVYAAVYAAAELCTYLEGQVQEQFGEPLLSALFRIINTPLAPGRLVAYACGAIVNFTNSLQDSLPQSFIQHGPIIINKLLELINNENSRDDVRLKAMSAAAQSASVLASEKHFNEKMLMNFLDAFWPMLQGYVDDDTKARAIDCATLLASSVDKEMLEPHSQKLITSLMHIEQTHTEADDPCTMQVLTGLVRLAEVLREDFLPHVNAVIPRLLRIASTQVDQPYEPIAGLQAEEEEELDDEENFVTTSSATGTTVKVNSSSLQEKTQAIQLLTSLAHSLGVGLTETGESQNTTGEWMCYAETMLNVAANLVGYEYSSDVRQASAAALPALINAFATCTRYPQEYNKNRMKSIVAPLLAAMAIEQDPDVLSAQFAATSDIVLAAPEIFSSSDAETFVNTCREQIEELQRVISEARISYDKLAIEEYNIAIRSALEYMSSSLQAFIKITGPLFPSHGLFGVLNQAIREQLGLDGEKEWAVRLICDLIQYASPAAVAWTSGLLSIVGQGLSDLEPLIRQISAFTVGVAAMNPEGLYAPFVQSCLEPLCNGLAVETDLEDEAEALAHDNFLSALTKIISFSSILKVSGDDLLVPWLKALPIREDVDEMQMTYGLLLDIIAREHPYVAAEHEEVRNQVLEVFAATLSNPKMPAQLQEPLSTGFRIYLSRCPMETQHAWAAKLAQ